MTDFSESTTPSAPPCPLCQELTLHLFFTQRERVPWNLYAPGSETPGGLRFFRCAVCDLITKDPAVRTTTEQERRHYAKHNNNLSDAGYREHLMKLIRPLADEIPPNAKGLDYGCGPTLSIEKLLAEQSISCSSFDPFFFQDAATLTQSSFDFVTCSEVVEHFREPVKDFAKVISLVKSGGVLAIMTQFPPPSFEQWWYHRDPTHVHFYSRRTFDWLASHWSLTTVFHAENVVILRR